MLKQKYINDILRQDKKWDWFSISSNPNITWDIIQANPNKPWNWNCLSYNKNITWDIIKANPDKSWDWYYISSNKNLIGKIQYD
jgi:hypothetical protein